MTYQLKRLVVLLVALTSTATGVAVAQQTGSSSGGSTGPTTTAQPAGSSSAIFGIDNSAAPPDVGQNSSASGANGGSNATPLPVEKSARPLIVSPGSTDYSPAPTKSPSRTMGGGPNDFQDFVAHNGTPLPLFGQELFQGAPTTFAPVDDAPVASDYIVGPGDEIQIRAWGQIDVDVRVQVDRNGMLNIPRVGSVNVAGVRNQDLQTIIQAEFAKLYRNFTLVVRFGQLRPIQIFLVGQARQPGSFTVSPMSTLVNALFASGGPSSKGTMRRIQVRRANQLITEFDLYDMLIRGDTSKDVRLQQGDVIFFPPVGPQVALHGSVTLPAIYELKDPETSLADVLGWAGGLTTTADGQRATLERIEDHRMRKLDEFELTAGGRQRALRDGDIINVYAILPRIANAVTLRGFVARPLRLPWHDGLRVADLIPDRDAVLAPSYSGTFSRPEEVDWDYAVVERLQPDLTTTLVPFKLGKAIIDNDPQENLLLNPGDIVVVFSKSDARASREHQANYVRLEGEFLASGVYVARQGETLQQLVTRVGGLSPIGYLYGAEFTRESVRVAQQRQLDELVGRMDAEVRQLSLERQSAAANTEAGQATQQQLLAQQALIERMRQVRATGRIVLEVPPNGTIGDLPNITLEEGDKFYVPPTPSVVSVLGAVFNQNSYVFQQRKTVGHYLAKAGGPTKSSDKSSIFLLRANGTVISNQQRSWTGSVEGERMLPGDAVVVPEDLDRYALTRNLKDWAQIFYQFALGVAGLKVLRL